MAASSTSAAPRSGSATSPTTSPEACSRPEASDRAYTLDCEEPVWRLLDGLGFSGGAVLEPGSGAGTFIGLAPESAQMTGVELDPLTAAICAELYPHATIRAESFADTRLPEGHFDAAIGNVPFSSVTLHDPLHNATRQSMHNYFIIKSLRLTRPGGLVAVLTSHFTMDAQNPVLAAMENCP